MLSRTRSRPTPLTVLLLAFLLASGVVAAPAQAAPDASAETEFACLANEARKDVGVARLRVASDLTTIARRHSVRMADQNHLHHNPNYSSEVKGWTVVAENVGRGPSVSSLHTAFMNSAGHRRNIVDSRFTEVGMGVERRGSTVWITQLFRKPTSSSSAPYPSCGSTATAPTAAKTVPVPVTGDWNGNGKATPGIFHDGRWQLSNRLSAGADVVVDYGRKGDIPIVGDWNKDGKDTLGVIRDGQWHLKNSLSGGGADISFTYGRITRGDIPIAGDWNGNGYDTIGIIRDGQWHLKNSLSGGSADISFTYGRITRGDIPIVGDWNNNGIDGIGIIRVGEWHLRNSLSAGPGQIVFTYGRVTKGDVPLAGDWTRDGRDTPAIVRGGRVWHLRNTNTAGPADRAFAFGG